MCIGVDTCVCVCVCVTLLARIDTTADDTDYGFIDCVESH